MGRKPIPTPSDIRRTGASTKRRREILERAANAPQLSATARDVIPFHKVAQFGPTASASTPDGYRVWLFTTESYARRFRIAFSRYIK